MPLRFARSFIIGLLVCSLLSAPVTWSGGASAAHPHMFLQLWHDVATETFPRHHGGHHHHHVERLSPFYAKPLTLIDAGDDDQPTISTLGAFSWTMTVVQAGTASLLPEVPRARPMPIHSSDVLEGIMPRPEIPPPERIAS